MDSHSLIERIKNQDGEKELKELYSLYRNDFVQWAVRKYSCTIEEAQDTFQQVVIIFYENIITGKLENITTQINTYLFSIGKNKILELIRKKKKSIPADYPEYFIDTDLFYGSEQEHYEEELNKVTQCLEAMGDPCKTILVQYYYHKSNMNEISDALEYKNSDTVKNLKYKCIQRLKKLFISDNQTAKVNRL